MTQLTAAYAKPTWKLRRTDLAPDRPRTGESSIRCGRGHRKDVLVNIGHGSDDAASGRGSVTLIQEYRTAFTDMDPYSRMLAL